MEEARGNHNQHNHDSVMEMRMLQPNGSSALLDASVWTERTPSTVGHGSNILSGGRQDRMTGHTIATGGSQLWGGEEGGGGGDGLDFLLAYHNHHQQSLIEQRELQQQAMIRGGTRRSTPSNVRSRNPTPSNPAPFGSVSGRSFTPTHDSVIGALPPPWGLVSPHHSTG